MPTTALTDGVLPNNLQSPAAEPCRGEGASRSVCVKTIQRGFRLRSRDKCSTRYLLHDDRAISNTTEPLSQLLNPGSLSNRLWPSRQFVLFSISRPNGNSVVLVDVLMVCGGAGGRRKYGAAGCGLEQQATIREDIGLRLGARGAYPLSLPRKLLPKKNHFRC